jgi:hypothetical protein
MSGKTAAKHLAGSFLSVFGALADFQPKHFFWGEVDDANPGLRREVRKGPGTGASAKNGRKDRLAKKGAFFDKFSEARIALAN